MCSRMSELNDEDLVDYEEDETVEEKPADEAKKCANAPWASCMCHLQHERSWPPGRLLASGLCCMAMVHLW